MILYCGDHDVEFDTDHDTETHRFCHDAAGRRLTDDKPEEEVKEAERFLTKLCGVPISFRERFWR